MAPLDGMVAFARRFSGGAEGGARDLRPDRSAHEAGRACRLPARVPRVAAARARGRRAVADEDAPGFTPLASRSSRLPRWIMSGRPSASPDCVAICWLSVRVGQYGQYRQEVLDPGSALHRFGPQAVLFALTAREVVATADLSVSAADVESMVSARIEELSALWRMVRERSPVAVIQQTFLNVADPLFGSYERLVPGAPVAGDRTAERPPRGRRGGGGGRPPRSCPGRRTGRPRRLVRPIQVAPGQDGGSLAGGAGVRRTGGPDPRRPAGPVPEVPRARPRQHPLGRRDRRRRHRGNRARRGQRAAARRTWRCSGTRGSCGSAA